MARFHTLIGLGLASTMLMTAPAFASSAAATAKPAAHSVAAAKPAAVAAPKRAVSTRQNTHLAKATLSNGKKVTYNCRLAGNKNKQACKG